MMETNQQQQQQQQRRRHHSSQQGHPQLPPPQRHSHKWHHAFSSFCLTFWLLIIMALLLGPVTPEVIYRVDPLALLAATLRTYQRAGCDSEQLALSCPRGTSISIELAQYGRAGDLSDHSLCPPISEEDLTTTGSAGDGGVIHSGTEIEVKPPETCTVSGLQYALLQTVVDTCQKKRHCKFAANPKSLSSGDPCSGVRKFVEIAYKCRPYEFRSKVACENDNMPLVCNPYSRIAIYSASFGHTEKESVQCGGVGGGGPVSDTGDQSNVKQTCLVSYATETVMQICHGRRRCSVTADAGTFGRPCKNDVRMYLKVVYTCIPRKVLKDRYETAPEADEPQQSELDMDQDELYDEDQFYKESEAIPPAPKLQGAIPNHGGYPYDFNDASISRGAGGGSADGGTTTLIPPLLSRNDSSLEDGLRLGSAFAWFRQRPANAEAADYAAPSPSGDEATTSDSPDEEVPWQARIADASPNANRNVFYKRHPCPDEASVDCTPTIERVEVVGFLVDWIRVYQHIRKNQEEFYLYLIISVVLGVLLCLTLVIGRLALQRKRSSRKNSSSSGNAAAAKGCNDTGSAGGGGSKYPQTQSGDMNLPNSFGDDISDIDADIDLTSPMPVVSSLPSRNETYLSYAPTSACTYGSLQPQSTATTLLMPSSTHPGGLLMSSHNPNQNELKAAIDGCSGQSGVGGGQSRQSSPSPAQLYTSMGICSPTVSGTMTMGSSHVLAPSTLNSMAQGTSYLSTGPPMMVPGTGHHQHMPHVLAGTLRRTYIPTSMGIMGGSGMPSTAVGLTGMPGGPSSTSGGIYYDSTVPRGTMNRGMSVDNNAQYFYG